MLSVFALKHLRLSVRVAVTLRYSDKKSNFQCNNISRLHGYCYTSRLINEESTKCSASNRSPSGCKFGGGFTSPTTESPRIPVVRETYKMSTLLISGWGHRSTKSSALQEWASSFAALWQDTFQFASIWNSQSLNPHVEMSQSICFLCSYSPSL